MTSQDSAPAFLGPLCALGSSITWALAATVYTQTAGRIGPLRTNFFRAIIVLPLFVLCASLLYGPRAILAVPFSQVGWLGLSAVCSYALGDLLYYMAALRLGSATALAIASIYPVWAALFGALFLGEAVGPARALGTLACISGVAWLVLQQRDRSAQDQAKADASAAPRPWLIGVLLAFFTSVLWAGNAYSIRRGSVAQPFLVVNALRYGTAVVLLSLTLALRRKSRPSHASSASALTPRFLGIVLLEAFFGSSIFVYGLSHSDLSVGAPLSSLAPLFSVPIGVILRTESLNVRRLLAIIITVGGVVLLVR